MDTTDIRRNSIIVVPNVVDPLASTWRCDHERHWLEKLVNLYSKQRRPSVVAFKHGLDSDTVKLWEALLSQGKELLRQVEGLASGTGVSQSFIT